MVIEPPSPSSIIKHEDTRARRVTEEVQRCVPNNVYSQVLAPLLDSRSLNTLGLGQAFKSSFPTSISDEYPLPKKQEIGLVSNFESLICPEENTTSHSLKEGVVDLLLGTCLLFWNQTNLHNPLSVMHK
ncbi:hypothetical protein F0562_012520 [Nyssa sinensis]|uniref:Uncharacterized protein n=1 Tax=Nyssa sinensis TaxID=561372 RepID=A0A5J4ZW46_9ASTE|nr:hypothetical protein F0562_012520 [Nyssa sinensis]